MAETGKNNLGEQVAMLPLSPGVYQFVDRSGTIIYVGEAKSLRKRVSSISCRARSTAPKCVLQCGRSPRSTISSSTARPTRCCSKIR
ncbi:MAG: hypothetical protein ACLRMJ_11210 [Alistipes finegoldii]